ncbi:hypothetical protein SADUNF_Sadunf04G0124200 [Salix dunnii]|uniref:Uncharacterized protein n=1 Tax=Salix dunnii TaxID=1413687 RepID=A0A835KEL3_9ROSI|nr:hypothetical protein SADUNF_Sadunf04G0124200 [Salix dunnii]
MGLSGHLPVALGNLTSLQTLSLWFNALSGPIPVDIGYIISNGDSGGDKLSGGAIAGIVIGFLLILLISIFLCRRKREKKEVRSKGVEQPREREVEIPGEKAAGGSGDELSGGANAGTVIVCVIGFLLILWFLISIFSGRRKGEKKVGSKGVEQPREREVEIPGEKAAGGSGNKLSGDKRKEEKAASMGLDLKTYRGRQLGLGFCLVGAWKKWKTGMPVCHLQPKQVFDRLIKYRKHV